MKGGKGKNLTSLREAGFNVPDFDVIESELLSNSLPEKINKAVAEITARIDSEKYAVRSSADVEDSSHKSFAGIFQSYLNLFKDEVTAKVFAVMKSSMPKRKSLLTGWAEVPFLALLLAPTITENILA